MLMKIKFIKTEVDKAVVKVVAGLDRVYQKWFFRKQNGPVVSGSYYVGNQNRCVAVCTLGSINLMKQIGISEEIAITGKTFTENLGIEKMVRNIITNPAIRILILCGDESHHRVGQSIVALKQNGMDGQGNIIGSLGRLPRLKNIRTDQVQRFQDQIEIIDLIGENDVEVVLEGVKAANARELSVFQDQEGMENQSPENEVEQIYCKHRESVYYQPDPAGFFVIQINIDSKEILAEHYSIDYKLLRTLHGKTALQIYATAIRNKWITNMGHAAYLGRELGKAEIALTRGLLYEQNKELMER